jgi:proteasome assembly chaperone (PAC2) family protein
VAAGCRGAGCLDGTTPEERQNLIVFIGEAQPPLGKYAFCRKLIEKVKNLGVEQIFTFAAMATQMHPEHESHVFAAAIDAASLADLKRQEVEVLEDGHIGGLNGVLLGVAAEFAMRGASLLGEMPHVFVQLPFPRASLAVLKAFSKIVGIHVNLDELAQQAYTVGEELGKILERAERAIESADVGEMEDRPFNPEPAEEGKLSTADERRLEQLLEQAREDRSKACELKRELDRLEVFKDYEDRFLDLFKTKE